ncbi:putative gpi transamidase component [Leishmania mexicana MHOM/GT/2001/U1103]|uniref:Gpi transamidase component n=1 Tax=Leishmania mexicana (strain MHOM/GT/2001/U1103) TaxID=929439 RepID=E9B563_LEIMU|nr:putative gpi transamidase component [Leishmania mexicana MHOM/GT/2001/U1103]CBZ30383.1 putative gpi transamidase component [Leishmania mexicana MHOM/GT/2001/U1103]
MAHGDMHILERRQSASGVLLAFAVVVLTWVAAAATASSHPYAANTSRRYSMMVEELTGSLDERGTTPTLVSVAMEMSLTLPAKPGAAMVWEGDAEASEIDDAAVQRLTFDDDFDPIWYYVLRRRGFERLDWCGCGGKWRPEWSISKALSAENENNSVLFGRLRHFLAHHAVCTYSSVSFCGASHERGAASQFQWAAQFVSTLTSSPLSWTAATPRHSRPNGIVIQRAPSHVSGGEDAYWCSYHLVYHDTLCTQHVSPLLNGGRSGRGVQEGLPQGIFNAAFPSFVTYFGAPFQHFTVKATQERLPGNSTVAQPPTVRLKVEVRMSMVVGDASDLEALSEVWSRELPAYARDGRLQVHIGPGGLSQQLRSALPAVAIVSSPREGQAIATPQRQASASASPSSRIGRSPEVQYEVRAHGKDHGYLTVNLQPALVLLDPHVGVDAEKHEGSDGTEEGSGLHHSFLLREGDVVRTLLLFPLHLVRPSLYNMESLLGSTRIVHAHVDVVSNTLAVLLETTVATVHVAAYEAAYAHARQCHEMAGGDGAGGRACRAHDGVLLGRFQLFFGWSALREMPPDDNSNRLVPQPVVVIHRARSSADLGAAEASFQSDLCRIQRHHAASVGAIPQLDHEDSLAAVFQLLNRSDALPDGKRGSLSAMMATLKGDDACVYWVRSTVASGTTIPGPDGAMVFNVLSLGLFFLSAAAGTLTRLTRRLTCKREDLVNLLAQEGATTVVR